MGLPLLARVLYLQGMRRHMDYKTGIVGFKRSISYQSLREVGFVDHNQGRAGAGGITVKAVRVAIKNLMNAGLLEQIEADRRLVFRCILADLDESVSNKEGRRRADVGQTYDGRAQPSNCNGYDDKEGRRRADPKPQKEGNPQESVNRIEEGVNTPVEFASQLDRDAPATIVFRYWQETMNHKRAKLDAKRKRAIAARLRDGYSVDDIKQAIDGCKASPWHQGKNDRQAKFDDIELICRDATKLDGFRRVSEQSSQYDDELNDWFNEDRIIEGNFNVVG